MKAHIITDSDDQDWINVQIFYKQLNDLVNKDFSRVPYAHVAFSFTMAVRAAVFVNLVKQLS